VPVASLIFPSFAENMKRDKTKQTKNRRCGQAYRLFLLTNHFEKKVSRKIVPYFECKGRMSGIVLTAFLVRAEHAKKSHGETLQFSKKH
jgi:hypothetical protein